MENQEDELLLDQPQVLKAVQALQACIKSTSSSQKLFPDEDHAVSLLFTLWKIPKLEQTIRIPLPHGLRPESVDVCLFTKDQPNMTTHETQTFFKKLLTENGVKHPIEVIPFKVLSTEYKPFEAKRRLVGNFDLFLADARIQRRLPSHIGKSFYQRKKVPLSVRLDSKSLARDLKRLIDGTTISVSNKGSCCMARVAHLGMTADEIVENVISAVSTISKKLQTTGKNIKLIHLKSQTSVALPIYTSDLSNLALVEAQMKAQKVAQKRKSEITKTEVSKPITKETEKDEDGEEEIPQLVPIKTPTKMPKGKGTYKKGMKKSPKPRGKGLKKTSKRQTGHKQQRSQNVT